MPSPLKSDTARTNGAKSRGPKSPETRAISAQNALKHGFTSRHTTLLECENPEEFAQTQAEHIATYRPGNDAQQDLIDEMVSARWRIRRIRVAESVLIDLEMRRNHLEVEKQFPDPEPVVYVAEAIRTLFDDSCSISLISRYESRLFRMHDRAYRTLRELQKAGPVQPHSGNTSVDPCEPDLEPAPPAAQLEAQPATAEPSEPESKNDETNPASRASSAREALQRHHSTKISWPRFVPRRRSQGPVTTLDSAIGRLLRRK
jgi:hypothetical protein